MDGVRRMLAEAWAALGGPEAAVDAASLPDRGAGLPCPLPVGDLACATVAAALLAAAELAAARGAAWPRAELDALHVAAAFRSERALRLDGVAPGAPFDPVSA
ncbi:MAG TPA: hypothetical protein VLA98_04360, partial [Solirubrobacteraceae bacterium]|nr:hypothetical protein [Solirubrobacteraceae bacterium]